MRSIVQFSLKNTLALLLAVLLLMTGGIYSLKELHMEKYPNVDIPYFYVTIPYPGASPEQAMDDIGEQLEKELIVVEGAKNVFVDGVANAVYATIEFDMSMDMEEAEQAVKSSVDKISLPQLAGKPWFESSSPGGNLNVYAVGIYSEQLNEETQTFVEENVLPPLQAIEGVSQIELNGVTEDYLLIRLLPEKLEDKGLTINDVKTAILANNLISPIGDISLKEEILPVRVDKQSQSVDNLRKLKLFIQNPTMATIQLDEVAEITLESEYLNSITRINGKQGISVSIVADAGVDIISIVQQAKQEMERINLPEGYQIETLLDQSIEIQHSVHSMLREVLLGALMAVIVTLVFLRNIRSTIIAVVSIPVSIFGSFLVMKLMGYTLNLMTLAGIAVAVGRVVDDSIVVIENIFRRVRSTKKKDDALIEQATREVASAITSSTITTIAVFVPLAFVPGIVGGFFKPLAWTIVISLLISLLVAITIVPLLSKIFLLNIELKEHNENAMQIWYRKSLTWVLKHRLMTLVMAIFMLISSVALIAPNLGTTFLPQEKSNQFDIEIMMEKGTVPAKIIEATNKVENILLTQDEISYVHTNINEKSAHAMISIVVNDSVEQIDEFIYELKKKFTRITEPEEITVSGVGGIIGGSESRYVLVVKGANMDSIQTASGQIVEALKELEGMEDVTTSLEGENPEIVIDLDEDKLAENGLMPAQVSQSLRTLIEGDIITTIRLDGHIKDVKLGVKMENPSSIKELATQQIHNIMGKPVALGDIGEVKKVNNVSRVSHLNGHEYVMVFGTITDGKVGDIIAQADQKISDLQLPENVSYYKEGVSSYMSDGFENLTIAIIISIVLVYFVMVLAFKEGRAPFVILFAIPFSIIGALLGLYIVNEPIGMPAMIGLLMLNGIVVTNAIVLVDKVKQNEKIGMMKDQALIEAGVIRMRPILMTAIATIGALAPLAISNEVGLISKSLSVVVIGGLTTSTFLTLFIVPVLFSLLNFKKG